MPIGPLTPLPELEQLRDELNRVLDPRSPDYPKDEQERARLFERRIHVEMLIIEAKDEQKSVTRIKYRRAG